MKPLRLEEVARIAGGTLLGAVEPSAAGVGVKVDSRSVAPGEIFVALKGKFLDGHDYVEDAARRGAVAAIVTEEIYDSSVPLVLVPKPLAALTALASYNRDMVDPIVIGISGSTGKTSTKDFLAAVASVKFRTVASERSYNNELGVPLTLLEAGEETEVVVVEMGARGRGQISELCEYARPHVGVVTNVGVTHFEHFGSREAIADSKAELVASLDDAGAAVLNADDPLVANMASRTSANVVTFGLSPGASVRAERVSVDRIGRPTFRLVSHGEAAWVNLKMNGAHQVHNALAAAAAAAAVEIPIESVRFGLETASASPWRMEVREVRDVIIVNDAYNSNPSSVTAALETCAEMASRGTSVPAGGLIAILGYMAELGDISEGEHRRVGALAASLAKRLIVVGDTAASIAEGASEAGMSEVVVVGGPSEVRSRLGTPAAGDVVLVKGSRIAGLENLAAEIAEGLSA